MAVTAIAGLLVPSSLAGAPVTAAQVAACVRDNLLKYAPPDQAVIVQYLNLEAACRATLEGDDGTQVQVTALGRDDADDERATAAGERGDTGGDIPSPPPNDATSAIGSATSADAESADLTRRGAAPEGEDAAPRPSSRPGSTIAQVRGALAASEVDGPVSTASVRVAPAWLLGLAGVLIGAAVAGAVWRTRSRPR
ncbi:MAG TPA: hypothetical protein PKD59_14965 [Miltoncostaeaceae bacterium]|nr:hypothetical protein [Miltoncostaeaceae bacterium]